MYSTTTKMAVVAESEPHQRTGMGAAGNTMDTTA